MAYKKAIAEIPSIDVNLVTILPAGSVDEIGFETASKVKVEVQSEEEKAVKLVVKGRLRAQKPAQTTITGNQITLTDNVFNPELVTILQGGAITYNKILTHTPTGALVAGNYYFSLGNNKYVTFTTVEDLAASDTIVFDDKGTTVKVTKSGVATSITGTITGTTSGTLLATTSVDGAEVKKYAPPVAGSADKGDVFVLNCYSAVYDAAGLIVKYEKISYPNCTGVPVAFGSEDGSFRAPEYTINSAPATGQAPYEIEYVTELPVLV